MRTRVYVSGPYTSAPEANTYDALSVGQVLLDHGYAPFVPHLTHFWHKWRPNSYDAWLDLDLAWVEAADVVLRMEGKSPGADEEVELAESLGIPVFYDVSDLLDCVPPTRPVVPTAVEQALARVRKVFRNKNADYADDADWKSNFVDVSQQMGFASPQEACEVLIAVKQARLKALRANGREPANEAVEDTVLDRAVYALIRLAMDMEESF